MNVLNYTFNSEPRRQEAEGTRQRAQRNSIRPDAENHRTLLLDAMPCLALPLAFALRDCVILNILNSTKVCNDLPELVRFHFDLPLGQVPG